MLDFIIDKILKQENRLITYSEYMDMVLYTPDKGYYMKNRGKIGKEGDFYTTVNLADILGTVLGKWFCHLFRTAAVPPVICELGGGTGKLARNILDTIQATNPEIFNNVFYFIVETSPYHQTIQKETLKSFPKSRVVSKIEEIGTIEGIIFSNEFFDAFPVHVIQNNKGNLCEVMVGYNSSDKCLIEEYIPLKNREIINYLEQEQIILQDGQRLEIPISMLNYLERIKQAMSTGFLVTLDYGYVNEDWKLPQHRDGSLRGYHKHRMHDDVLVSPGEMDITAHIHFDGLTHRLEQMGFKHQYLLKQDEFLLKLGILNELEEHYDPNPFSNQSRRNRAIRDLLIPGGISSFFKVSIETSGIMDIEQKLFPDL